MAEAVLVQGLVGVGHVYAVFQELSGKPAPGLVMPRVGEDLVSGLAPDVGPPAQAQVGLEVELLIRQHAERRDDVFLEVLVLVVPPHQDEIGLERVDLRANLPERVEDTRLVRLVGRDAFVVPPFEAHRLGPVGGIAQALGNAPVALQHARERPRFELLGNHSRRVMGRAYAQNLCHD